MIAPPPNIPNIGTLPPNFNQDLSTYDHVQILALIIFYREDFGILAGDSLVLRVEKLHRFLAEY
jgi:hypothetical protein